VRSLWPYCSADRGTADVPADTTLCFFCSASCARKTQYGADERPWSSRREQQCRPTRTAYFSCTSPNSTAPTVCRTGRRGCNDPGLQVVEQSSAGVSGCLFGARRCGNYIPNCQLTCWRETSCGSRVGRWCTTNYAHCRTCPEFCPGLCLNWYTERTMLLMGSRVLLCFPVLGSRYRMPHR
jgi:hypothetical protein